MQYMSLFSGIEAVSVAWEPLGFSPISFAEVDVYASSVLTHHFPTVPNLGDVNEYRKWAEYSPDIIVGGSPCQSFSTMGFRAGLNDPRGNLMLVFLAVINRYKPRWVLWENVPGVLSIDKGRAFGSLVGGLAELGYGYAWRVLDAQYYGIAQRRKRVFVVACLGDDWRPPAQVLFEADGGFRDSDSCEGEKENSPRGIRARAQSVNWSVSDDIAVYSGSVGSWAKGIATLLANTAFGFTTLVVTPNGVRRLTPVECERMQGFPDDYTLVNFNGKQVKNIHRYRALGNSMAVPVIQWIGYRIQMVDRYKNLYYKFY